MGDIIQRQDRGVPLTMQTRFRDMGDGTHAEVVAAVIQETISVNDSGGSLTVDDGAGSLTVDDGAGSLTVDDGAGSLTVDGTVTANQGGAPWQVYLATSGGTALKTVSEKLRTSSMPYLYDIAEGNVAGHTAWAKIGYNGDVDNAQETVWTAGGMYTFPTSAMGMEVVSTDNTNDKAGGTGALTVRIGYLDGNYAEQSETVTLNGTTVVATVATNILRVNSFRVATAGSTGRAAGTISLRHLSDTPIYSQIAAGQSRARNSVYTVPAGKILYVTSVFASTATGTATPQYCLVTLYANYDDLMGVLAFMQPQLEMLIEEQAVIRPLEIPLRFTAQTDLYMAALGQGATSSLIVTTSLRGWVE